MRLPLCALALLAACGAPASITAPGPLIEVPGNSPADQTCWIARGQVDAGDSKQALETIARVLAELPDHTDALRVRQDALRARGRLGLALFEAEQRMKAEPGRAAAAYLLGRLARGDDDKRDWFARCLSVQPQSFWGWLGTAFVLRGTDTQRALAVYHQLFEASHRHPLAGTAFASALRGAGRPEDAIKVYEAMRTQQLAPGLAELGIAETYFSAGQRDAAWQPLLRAIELRPGDPGVRRLAHELVTTGLPRDRIEAMVDAMIADPERRRALLAHGGGATVATLLAAAQRPFAARAVLANDIDPWSSPQVQRTWRRLLLATGDVAAFLDALAASVPAALLADEANQLRGLWLRVLGHRDASLAERSELTALTRDLLAVGLLEEAEAVADIGLLRGSAGLDDLGALRDEARRELAFEHAVRDLLYRGYTTETEAKTLQACLARVRELSQQILGQDVVGTPKRFHVPFVGELLDPFAPGLCAHFAHYNQHLVLGQRNGEPVEGMLLVRLSVRDLVADRELPVPTRAFEVIGEDRRIRSLSGVYGGDLAGVALLNHFVVDFDSVRDWAGEIAERRHVAREDDAVVLRDPLPADVDDLEPAGANWRLEHEASCADDQLLGAVLEMIRWHERAHLVDVFHYLPLENNLLRALGLLLEHWFSRTSIEAEMEARAETAALAFGSQPQLVLAHLAVFLDGPRVDSPHSLGFRRLAQRFSAALRARGLDDRVSRWHQLDPALVHEIGRQLFAALH